MSASRARGTAWETAIARYLVEEGWPHAERRAGNGIHDRGDITGLPLVVVEAKSAQRLELAAWLEEAHLEQVNAGAEVSVVWIKRRGRTSPARGYVVMDGAAFTDLLRKAGY